MQTLKLLKENIGLGVSFQGSPDQGHSGGLWKLRAATKASKEIETTALQLH